MSGLSHDRITEILYGTISLCVNVSTAAYIILFAHELDAFLLKELRKFQTGTGGGRGREGPRGSEVVKPVADSLRFYSFFHVYFPSSTELEP